MNARPTLVIVDDHPLFRQGLKQLIERADQFDIVGEAGDGPAGLVLIVEKNPEIAVLDLSLPEMSGLEIAEQVQRKALRTRLIILTMHKEEETFNRAMDLGVVGFVLKDNAVEDIANCVAAVARGEHYLSPSISSYLVRRHGRVEELAARRPGLESLTKAERRILKMIADKKTSPQIAAELFISPRTVEAHRANACAKLGLHGSHSLLLFALENRTAL
ncbi:MAG TPA: response regulator transcription factor [Opitutaceae bacterium]|jgi:DNA-binding NarL/FixJ family response regulator